MDAAPRKIPQAERESTKAHLREKVFPGFKLEKELEPASFFEDRFVRMSVRNAEHRIQTACCATSSAELVACAECQNRVVRQEAREDSHESMLSRFTSTLSWAGY